MKTDPAMSEKQRQIWEAIKQVQAKRLDPLSEWAAQAIERGKAIEEKSNLQWPDCAVEADRIRLHALGVSLP